MKREFTGRDMTKVLVVGFGVVFAVNMLMATLAAQSFSGVVVENSYVASQKFNGWLEEARHSEELGWNARLQRGDDQHLLLVTEGVPPNALVTAELRRPLGAREDTNIAFSEAEVGGSLRSIQPLAPGRWIARVSIIAGSDRWVSEVPIE